MTEKDATGKDTSFENFFKNSFIESMKGMHTMLPGFIDEFDPITNTQTLEDGEVLNFPPLINVPVQFLRFSDFCITIPPKKGDECAIFFSERSLDAFLEFGEKNREVNDIRFFDLSDAFCVSGLYSKKNKINAFNENALEIRTNDGQVKIALYKDKTIEIKNDIINIKIDAAGKLEIKNATGELVDTISNIVHQLAIETVIIPSGSSAGTYNITGQALYSAYAMIVDSFKI